MRLRRAWLPAVLAAAALLVSSTAWADARSDAASLTIAATRLFHEMSAGKPALRIPAGILARSYGVAIFPSVLRVGLIVGGEHGRGVVMAREPDGLFSPPAFYSLNGGSVGAQLGAERSALIVVFNDRATFEELLDGHLVLGGDASMAAGPMGASTRMKAAVCTYTRRNGAFVGATFTGAVLTSARKADAALYGRTLTARQILEGKTGDAVVPGPAQELRAMVGRYAEVRTARR